MNKNPETEIKFSDKFTEEDLKIRADFPLLNKYDMAYLDNAATSQKPECVLNEEKKFYEEYNANPLRGLYNLSEMATEKYESARVTVQKFISAAVGREILFTRSASESLNLLAYSLGDLLLNEGDEIAISIMEHHSNMLPWQHAAKRKGAVLKYIECDMQGNVTEEELESVITEKTKIGAFTQISNVFGRLNDMKRLAEICHRKGAVLVADGAQSVPHIPVDVRALDVDFLAFSGHKMFAPMGIGVLYGKEEYLEKMPPFLTGGEMIDSVTREGAVYAELPHKFEAGTVNAAGAAGLAEAIRYIEKIGFDKIEERENKLTAYALWEMGKISHVKVIGSEDPDEHHGIITFTVEGVHPHDVAYILSADNIAVRAGHHCAQPLMKHLGVMSTTRASFAFYNTREEVDRFIESLKDLRRKMGYAE